jgi:hypothetical protein
VIQADLLDVAQRVIVEGELGTLENRLEALEGRLSG